MKIQFYLCSFTMLLALLTSCKTNSYEEVVGSVSESKSTNSKSDEIVFTGSYYQFKDLSSLYKSAADLQQIESGLKQLSENKNFESLRDVYNKVVKEESYFHEHVDLITEERKNSLLAYGYMGDYAKSYKDLFIFSQQEGIRMKLAYPSIAIFLTPDGLVKIGGKIYQFKEDVIKIIEDGNSDKVTLLKTTKTTDGSVGITVNPIRNLPIGVQSEVRVQSNQVGNTYGRSADNCIGSPCEYRVIGYENFTSNGGTSYSHTTTLRNLKRGFLGYWYDNNENNETGLITGHLNFKLGLFGDPLSNSMTNYRYQGYGTTVSVTYQFTLPEVNQFYVESGFIFACPSVYCQLY